VRKGNPKNIRGWEDLTRCAPQRQRLGLSLGNETHQPAPASAPLSRAASYCQPLPIPPPPPAPQSDMIQTPHNPPGLPRPKPEVCHSPVGWLHEGLHDIT
jgi:hypothetical protein